MLWFAALSLAVAICVAVLYKEAGQEHWVDARAASGTPSFMAGVQGDLEDDDEETQRHALLKQKTHGDQSLTPSM